MVGERSKVQGESRPKDTAGKYLVGGGGDKKEKKKIKKPHVLYSKQNFRIEEEGRTEFGATDHAPPWSERGDENYGQNLF